MVHLRLPQRSWRPSGAATAPASTRFPGTRRSHGCPVTPFLLGRRQNRGGTRGPAPPELRLGREEGFAAGLVHLRRASQGNMGSFCTCAASRSGGEEVVASTPQPGNPPETPGRRLSQSKNTLDRKREERRAFHLPEETDPPSLITPSLCRKVRACKPAGFLLPALNE